MKFNKAIFNQLVKKIGSNQGVYSTIRRYEKKFKAYTPESIFYFIAAKKNIKISKYGLEESILTKVDELLEKDKDPESRTKKQIQIVTKKVGKGDPYDFPLSKFNLDQELIDDCKLTKPYRSCVREALLTLETKIKKKLNVNKNGKPLIQECKSRGVFKRDERKKLKLPAANF